jgi:hypothetical protein
MRDLLLSVVSPEHLSFIGFLVLAAGLLGEVAVLTAPFDEHWSHKPLGFAFAALVLAGYVVGHIGDDEVAARSEARAIKAELELSKIKEPRTISEANQKNCWHACKRAQKGRYLSGPE